MPRLDGKVAIVTGSGRGLGRTFAQALAAEGARVAVCDVVDPQPTIDAIRNAGGDAFGVVADITDPAQLSRLVNQTQERFGSIDVLVNNAAVSASLRPQAFDAISLEEWDRVMTVNVRGTFQCIAAVAPVMRLQKSGKIVNIASGTVFKGSKGLCHYVASKAAILGLTRALAQELGEFGIGINAIAPGITASDTLVGTPAWTQMNSAVVASRAFKREESPEDLVGALLFLSSPDSDFMTGQCVVVDGGSVLH